MKNSHLLILSLGSALCVGMGFRFEFNYSILILLYLVSILVGLFLFVRLTEEESEALDEEEWRMIRKKREHQLDGLTDALKADDPEWKKLNPLHHVDPKPPANPKE